MDYKIKYSKESISELNKAFLWYQSKDISLGQKFKDAFRKVRLNLKENPKIFKEVDVNHRRAVLISSFPYTVHYLVDDKTREIKIIGVFHQSKNIEMTNEKIKIRKIHELKQEKDNRFKERKKHLEKLRQRQELNKDIGKERDRGLER
ncbi:MAG: type II toxin-antitoxin system RelE/ParE family toxin [bacterium]|nr:type II toxin-antitoxin system RelE/ParE family toxin [bacterium]